MMTYPKVVLSKSPPPAGERAWAYALGAVYNVGHGLPVDTTALDADPAEAAVETKQMTRMLERDWGITDRVTLVERLDGLGDGGHRRRFLPQLRFYATMWRPEVAARREELRANIRDGGEDAEGAAETLWRLNAVQADLPGLRASPLLAFDAGRAAMLFRCGLMLGWLGEPDWDYLVDAARDVRRNYASWAEYGTDFLLSRCVWSGSDTKDVFDDVVTMLLREPQSPWVRLPWDAPPLPVPRPVRPHLAGTPQWSLEGD
ncbi:MAG: DUF1266 domain-containing protein [Janthinobacterium lividum]